MGDIGDAALCGVTRSRFEEGSGSSSESDSNESIDERKSWYQHVHEQDREKNN